MNVPLKPADIKVLEIAAELLRRGHRLALETRDDCSIECVEIVDNLTAKMQRALSGPRTAVPGKDLAAAIDALD
jgi:hypothetical protein